MAGVRHILDLLRKHPEGLTAQQVADDLGTWPAQASRDLRRLERQGYVERNTGPQRNRWRYTDVVA